MIESRAWSYFLRIGDQSPRVPEYLVADLLLGRRERPTITVSATPQRQRQQTGAWRLRFTVSIANESLVWVPRIIAGVVGFQTPEIGQAPGLSRERASTPLLSAFSVQQRDDGWRPMAVIDRRRGDGLAPLEEMCADFNFDVEVQPNTRTIWRGVAFAAPSNGTPVYHQLDIRFQPTDSSDTSITDESAPVRIQEEAEIWFGNFPTYKWQRNQGQK